MYDLDGTRQRCLEAQLTPLRRRLAQEEGEGQSQPQPSQRRELSPTTNPTAEDCFQYCSTEGGFYEPFYFVVERTSATTADCLCCQECTEVYDPNATVRACVRAPSLARSLAWGSLEGGV